MDNLLNLEGFGGRHRFVPPLQETAGQLALTRDTDWGRLVRHLERHARVQVVRCIGKYCMERMQCKVCNVNYDMYVTYLMQCSVA